VNGIGADPDRLRVFALPATTLRPLRNRSAAERMRLAGCGPTI
jgi:hypothetical protein